MFIKFSDKTKNIIVKNSSKELSEEDREKYSDEECIFLDEKDSNDRRKKALSEPSEVKVEPKNA